jgi:hypothetical protein
MANPRWVYNIESLVTGLLTIEINTVEKAGMLAQKMPILPAALHQIVEVYDLFLTRMNYGVTARLLGLAGDHLDAIADKKGMGAVDDYELRSWRPVDEPVDRKDLMIDRPSFEALRWAAEAGLRDANALNLSPENQAILARIKANCRQLSPAISALQMRWNDQPAKELLKGTIDDVRNTLLQNPDMVVPVDSDILVLVRKMWDLGTATVLMQTSIQVDGDAANFLSPNLTDGQHDFALNAHRRVIEIAMAQWKSLFQLAASLASDIGKSFRAAR